MLKWTIWTLKQVKLKLRCQIDVHFFFKVREKGSLNLAIGEAMTNITEDSKIAQKREGFPR